MPWVGYRREKLRDDGNDYAADRYLNCSRCLLENSLTVRSSWLCGFLPPRKRMKGARPPIPAGFRGDVTVCPGYTMSLPGARAIASCLSWRQDGVLAEYLDGEPLTDVARLGMDLLAGEIRQVERHALREVGRGNK